MKRLEDWTVVLALGLALSLSSPMGQAAAEPAENKAPDSAAADPRLELGLPVLDLPFNTRPGFSFPSMPQARAITNSMTGLAQKTLYDLWRPGRIANRRTGGFWASLVIFHAYSFLPGWAHEEGHRAVLTSRGISSRDDIYFDPWAEMVSVSHVRDEDLAWLKDNHPADMARLAEAGGEAQLELVLQSRRASFFEGRSAKYDLVYWWLNAGACAWYIWYCSDPEVDRITEEETLKEDADIAKRDIVGGDYTSWVYDLFRPDEPYLAGLRGRPHPSGTGVDRYIAPSELSPQEFSYLKRQGRLALLNFLSPQFLGMSGFNGTVPFTGRPLRWNAGLAHHLTPFGTATDLTLLARINRLNLGLTYRSYLNRTTYWPGIEIEIHRWPLRLSGRSCGLSARLAAWLQPCGQRFGAGRGRAGGSLSARLDFRLRGPAGAFVEADAKTAGWLAGNPYLEAAFQLRTGLAWTASGY